MKGNKTDRFQTQIRKKTTESSTGSKNKEKYIEYEPQDRLNINLSRSDRGYEDILEEEVEEYDDDQIYDNRRNNNNRLPRDRDLLMVEALETITRRISQRDNRDRDVAPRESRLVDFPTFSAEDQDSIDWLESFEQACTANNVRNERMVSIAASYLKGTAITLFKQS